MKLTLTQCLIFGAKTRRDIHELDPRFEDWELFSRSFGFFQWKKKNQIDDEQLSAFREGWLREQALSNKDPEA